MGLAGPVVSLWCPCGICRTIVEIAIVQEIPDAGPEQE